MGHGVGGARPVVHFRNFDFDEKKEIKNKTQTVTFVTQM
jgi:hypothetical protein